MNAAIMGPPEMLSAAEGTLTPPQPAPVFDSPTFISAVRCQQVIFPSYELASRSCVPHPLHNCVDLELLRVDHNHILIRSLPWMERGCLFFGANNSL